MQDSVNRLRLLNTGLLYSLNCGFAIHLTVLFEGIFCQNLCFSHLRLGDQLMFEHVHVVLHSSVIVIELRKKSIYVIGSDN